MSLDAEQNEEFDAKSMTDMLKLLQKGEQTADSMENKLDLVERELDRLLEQLEQSETDKVTDKVADNYNNEKVNPSKEI